MELFSLPQSRISGLRIIVRVPNWLGDIVLSFPFLYSLREKFPQAEIFIIVRPEFFGLLKLLPFKVELIPFHKREYPNLWGLYKFSRKFSHLQYADYFFILTPSFSSTLIGLLLKAKNRIGFLGNWRGPMLNRGFKQVKGRHRAEEYLYLLEKPFQKFFDLSCLKSFNISVKPYFQNSHQGPYLVINPNSEASSRRLPLHQWQKILEKLSDRYKIVFIGGAGDTQRVEDLVRLVSKKVVFENLAGKTSIEDLISLLAYADGVISNDSGPAHLANFLGAPVIVFFGAGNSKNTGPVFKEGRSVLIVSKELECSPCLKNVCPLRTLSCLEELPMDYWLKEIEFFLFKNRKKKSE